MKTENEEIEAKITEWLDRLEQNQGSPSREIVTWLIESEKEKAAQRRDNARLREALSRIRTWGIKSAAFDAHDNRIMAEWVDAGCNGPLPEPEGPWIYREMPNVPHHLPRKAGTPDADTKEAE